MTKTSKFKTLQGQQHVTAAHSAVAPPATSVKRLRDDGLLLEEAERSSGDWFRFRGGGESRTVMVNNMVQLVRVGHGEMIWRRSMEQKTGVYNKMNLFNSVESSDYYGVCVCFHLRHLLLIIRVHGVIER